MYDDFVKLDSAPFYKNESGTDKKCHFLWGGWCVLPGFIGGE